MPLFLIYNCAWQYSYSTPFPYISLEFLSLYKWYSLFLRFISNPKGLLSATGSSIFQWDWFETKEVPLFLIHNCARQTAVYSSPLPHIFLGTSSLSKWKKTTCLTLISTVTPRIYYQPLVHLYSNPIDYKLKKCPCF